MSCQAGSAAKTTLQLVQPTLACLLVFQTLVTFLSRVHDLWIHEMRVPLIRATIGRTLSLP